MPSCYVSQHFEIGGFFRRKGLGDLLRLYQRPSSFRGSVHRFQLSRSYKTIQPIAVTPDGWIHDFRALSVIAKISLHSFNTGIFIIIISNRLHNPLTAKSTASIMRFSTFWANSTRNIQIFKRVEEDDPYGH